ncbi:hypothetical protein EJ04DRAFT_430690 [Polyplosphaeria fusca]|uniref:Uncharacterized protein n=1 Tax=Polyplosphaeria fusca TaxID=682080 RepID=A0A9P4V2L1_9PLEO|nr:hypothetical protein EJ04DRAFT_430690 [Polyplosphaeria fusca]
MSKPLMDTEAGGEQTQYEGTHTHIDPPPRNPGQLGDPTQGTTLADKQLKQASTAANTQGVTPAEKVRYGQSIQEGGAGGKTEGMEGQARTEGGFGGTERLNEDAAGGLAKEGRREQGYGGDRDMDREIGG